MPGPRQRTGMGSRMVAASRLWLASLPAEPLEVSRLDVLLKGMDPFHQVGARGKIFREFRYIVLIQGESL